MLDFQGNKARWYRFVLKYKNLKNASGNFIGKGSIIVNGTKIGDGTRFVGRVMIKGKGGCSIGKYNAIGDGVKIVTSNHRMDTALLQYMLIKKIGLQTSVDRRQGVTIGHNCWISDESFIVPGVTIGNGAVIGAGSVVTKDVPPYGIVAGAPAKFIRYRLPQERIDELEELQWWNWSIEEMRSKKHLLH